MYFYMRSLFANRVLGLYQLMMGFCIPSRQRSQFVVRDDEDNCDSREATARNDLKSIRVWMEIVTYSKVVLLRALEALWK
jgi:hypothetical protein